MTSPRFVVSPPIVQGLQERLEPETIRHLRSLRLKVGDKIVLTDGCGAQREARIDSFTRDSASVTLLATLPEDNESTIGITLCMPVIKWDRLEWAIEKSTELGVREIRLVNCHRSENAVSSTRLERFHRIARAAAEQSQRSHVPTIAPPVSYEEIVSVPLHDHVRLLLHEGLRKDVKFAWPPELRTPEAVNFALLLGPAGGLTQQEVDLAQRAGWHPTGIGPRILRTETAAIAAITAIQLRCGDLGPTSAPTDPARTTQ